MAAVTTAAAVCLGAAAGVPAFAADDARAELLAKKERYVRAGYLLDLQRFATVTPPNPGAAVWWQQDALARDFTYDIHAMVTQGSAREVAYKKVWTCQRSWKTPNGCKSFADRREEFFAAALAKHGECAPSWRESSGFSTSC